jgi:hypothetical protein
LGHTDYLNALVGSEHERLPGPCHEELPVDQPCLQQAAALDAEQWKNDVDGRRWPVLGAQHAPATLSVKMATTNII